MEHKNCIQCQKPFTAADLPLKANFKRQKMCGMACANAYKKRFKVDVFWSRIDKSAGPAACWPWTGARAFFGHGTVAHWGTNKNASRVAWIVTHGDPGPLFVRHKCDNPVCCNPAHLEVGTHDDNMADKVKRGRACKTLTLEKVLEIKQLLAEAPRTYGWARRIADATGVDIPTVSRINTGANYSHIK